VVESIDLLQPFHPVKFVESPSVDFMVASEIQIYTAELSASRPWRYIDLICLQYTLAKGTWFHVILYQRTRKQRYFNQLSPKSLPTGRVQNNRQNKKDSEYPLAFALCRRHRAQEDTESNTN
jgi:hypothetical protein